MPMQLTSPSATGFFLSSMVLDLKYRRTLPIENKSKTRALKDFPIKVAFFRTVHFLFWDSGTHVHVAEKIPYCKR